MGINAWAVLTPILPGITDVEAMIGALPADVRVFLDRLRHPSVERLSQFLRTSYPEQQARYESLAARAIA